MEYIQLTQENLQKEHTCCNTAEKKGDHSVADEKARPKERMEEGPISYKTDVHGKVFVEYISTQAAWFPIQTDNWMHINCLWVSGSFKGCGYSGKLLEHYIANAKTKKMHGLMILSGKKKLPYLNDPPCLKYKGSTLAGETGEYVSVHLPFHAGGERPRFTDGILRPQCPENTFVSYYTDQYPFASQYTLKFAEWMNSWGRACVAHHITTREAIQSCPGPVGNYALFYGSTYLTNEIQSEKKAEGLWKIYGSEIVQAG